MKTLHLIDLTPLPIFEQLQIEEALLRADGKNYCIINRGSPRAIVMGISGIPSSLIDVNRAEQDSIPIIQRYSGGGTIIVDENTLFITLIFTKSDIDIHPFPEPIMRWTSQLYQNAWNIEGFGLKGNDYVIDDFKCGGNAQYIRKDRWLHHTSFLWDYTNENMDYLLLPEKQPGYRRSRPHADFLCRLKKYAPTLETLIDGLKKELVKRFDIRIVAWEDLTAIRQQEHRKATRWIDSSNH
ncbi:MAG: hypothetical protein HW387_1265 [Parachlamydiales bacterium]|nr:hypothetical protein [Parachlamydiales bacterium]